MRRILVERARKHHSAKRGGEPRQVSLDEAAIVSRQRVAEVMAVENALTSLEALDPRKGRIVELRFYGGLNVEETAEVLGISAPTVKLVNGERPKHGFTGPSARESVMRPERYKQVEELFTVARSWDILEGI